MTPLRARSLLLGHALAANEPIGAELRRGGLANAADAAEAGDLSRALRLAGFSEDVAVLAASWPASAAPAQRRLSRLPSTLVFHAPLVQTLCWFGFVAFGAATVTVAGGTATVEIGGARATVQLEPWGERFGAGE